MTTKALHSRWLGFCLLATTSLTLTASDFPTSPDKKPMRSMGSAAWVDCCWCHASDSGADRVGSYLGSASCEKAAGHRDEVCRHVQVENGRCSFISITHHNHTTKCEPVALTVRDGAKKIHLSPPKWTGNVCQNKPRAERKEFSLLTENLDAESEEADDSSAPGPAANPREGVLTSDGKVLEQDSDGKLMVYWTCGRDPSDDQKCLAQGFDHGSVLQTERAEAGGSSCLNVCTKMGDKFGSGFNAYYPGQY